MNCPVCTNADTRVLRKEGDRRRRECSRCKHRFTTEEREQSKLAMLDNAAEKAKETLHLLSEATK